MRTKLPIASVSGDLIGRRQVKGLVFAIARLELLRAEDALARFGIDKKLEPNRSFHRVEDAIQAPHHGTRAFGASQSD